MKKDKLSLETFYEKKRFLLLKSRRLGKSNDFVERLKREGIKVIEILPEPVPEAKMKEFVAHWWRILKDYQSGKMAGQLTNLIKTMLEEYDMLKEEK